MINSFGGDIFDFADVTGIGYIGMFFFFLIASLTCRKK